MDVKGPIVDDIAFGAKALSAASTLLAISNPLSALPAIAGVFGIFGHTAPDPLLVGITRGIQQIQQELVKIQNQLRKYHDDEMRELGAIENGVLELYSFLQDEQLAQETACYDAYRVSDLSDGVPSPVKPVFSAAWTSPDGPAPTLMNAPEFQPTGYETASSVWPSIGGSVVECMRFLQGKFPPRIGQSTNAFRISSILNAFQGAGISEDMRNRYSNSQTLAQIFDELRPIVQHAGVDAQLSWFAPAFTLGDIDWNAENLGLLKASLSGSILAGDDGAMKADLPAQNMLDPDAVSRAAAELLSISYWYDFIDTSNNQILPLALLGKNPFSRERLSSALDVVQISQAQQALLAGDFILPLAYARITNDASVSAMSRFLTSSQEDQSWWDNAASHDLASALEDNKLLARNLGLYLAWRRLLLTGHRVLAYRVAYATTGDPDYMDLVLGSVGPLVWSEGNKRWTVTTGGIVLPLPTPEELSAGNLFKTGSFDVLATVRGQLVNEIARYDIDEPNFASTPDERELLRIAASVGALP